MNKEEVQQRVLQNGKPLSLDKFTWDEETRTFTSTENNLVLDFRGINNCTFKTAFNCTFNTESGCTFNTGFGCTFDTGVRCVVVRRDIYKVIELKKDVKIKLNGFRIKGYAEIKDEVELVKKFCKYCGESL